MTDFAIRDMDEAMATIEVCRLEASRFRKIGLYVLADELQRTARNAEKWLVRAAKVYPERCGS